MTRKRRVTRRSAKQSEEKTIQKIQENISELPTESLEKLLGALSLDPESIKGIEGEESLEGSIALHPLSRKRRLDELPPGFKTIQEDNERIVDIGLEYDEDDFVIVFYYALHEMEKLCLHVDKSEIPVHQLFPSCIILELYEWDRRYCDTRRYSGPYLRATAHLFDILENVYLSGYLGSMKQYTTKKPPLSESSLQPPRSLSLEEEKHSECIARPKSPEPSEKRPSSPEPTPGPSSSGCIERGRLSSSSSTISIKESSISSQGYEIEDEEKFFQETVHDSDTPSSEDDDNIVHVLEYGFQQTRELVEIKFHVPDIEALSRDRIRLNVTDRSVTFYANSHGGTTHIFRISRLLGEVDSIKSTYDIVAIDIVRLLLKKKKLTSWKHCECIPKDAKLQWSQEMKTLLRDAPEEFKAGAMEDLTWKNSLRLESSSIDLLKPPATMFENLNYTFSSLDETLIRALELLTTKPERQDMIDVIGAIVLRKIKASKEKKRARKYTQTKSHSPHASAKSKPLFAKLSGTKKSPHGTESEIEEAASLKFHEAYDCHTRGEREKAVAGYTEAIKLKDNPNYYRHRARAYFETENYISAYLDGKVAIRSLGILDGSDCLVLCGRCEIAVGNPVCALNILSSVLKILPQINKEDGSSIEEILKDAKSVLPNIILAMDAIIRRKMRLTVGYLEYVVSFAYSSKGLNLQMAMIYLICREYEKGANLCVTLINKGMKIPLVFYILGKCTYYIGERGEAIAHLKRSLQLRRTKVVTLLIRRIKEIDSLLENGERNLRNGNIPAAKAYFSQALRKDTTNIRLREMIEEKIDFD